MKLLRRNTKAFEYLPWTGEETDLDEQGRHTGNYRPEYGEPVTKRGNISSPSGHTNQTFFGLDIRYTHTLVMAEDYEDITESGIIRWQGKLYEIKAVRPSLNGMSAALKEMTANNASNAEVSGG